MMNEFRFASASLLALLPAGVVGVLGLVGVLGACAKPEPSTPATPLSDLEVAPAQRRARRPSLPIAANERARDPNPPGTTLLPKSVFVDPYPPKDWKQCAGFVNTEGDDVTESFMDNCLEADRLRVRVYDPNGELEEDVYMEKIEPLTKWPAQQYLGIGGVIAKTTHWGTLQGGAQAVFYVSTNGKDACFQSVSAAGTALGSGHAETAIIVGGAKGYDEYALSCGKDALPDRQIAIYR